MIEQNQQSHKYVLFEHNLVLNLKVNIYNINYFAIYKAKDYIYLFENDQILKKYKLETNYILYQNFGYSKNGEYFYFQNTKSGTLFLLQLKSKKEILIQRNKISETILMNLYIIAQSTHSCLEFIDYNVGKKNSLIFQMEQNGIFQISDISPKNQYLIMHDYSSILLLELKGKKVNVLNKFKQYWDGTSPNALIFSHQYILLFQSNTINVRQFLSQFKNSKLIRKYSIDQNEFSVGCGSQNKVFIISSSFYNSLSYIRDINLSYGYLKETVLSSYWLTSNSGSRFIIVDRQQEQQINNNVSKASNVIFQIQSFSLVDQLLFEL